LAIALVTALAGMLITLLGATDRAAILMGIVPGRLSGLVGIAPAVPAWLTPLTSTLVHAGPLHLFLNLLMLVWCGLAVERVLGPLSLVLLYVVGAFAAGMAQWLSSPASMVPVVGASGAISAVIGAFALSFGQQKRLVRSEQLNRALNAAWLLAAWIVMQVMIGWLAGGQGFLLATPAHIGGFLAGLVLQRPLLMWHWRNA